MFSTLASRSNALFSNWLSRFLAGTRAAIKPITAVQQQLALEASRIQALTDLYPRAIMRAEAAS